MESGITMPNISGISSKDRKELEIFILKIDTFYQRIHLNGFSIRYDLENFLMEIDKNGRYYSKYYTSIHSICLKRAQNFRIAMQSTFKYCIQVADYALDKLLDKSDPQNHNIQLAYKMLIYRDMQINESMQDAYRSLSLRIVRLLAYWYFPQGDAESDTDEV
jgi:hypothetical protein